MNFLTTILIKMGFGAKSLDSIIAILTTIDSRLEAYEAAQAATVEKLSSEMDRQDAAVAEAVAKAEAAKAELAAKAEEATSNAAHAKRVRQNIGNLVA